MWPKISLVPRASFGSNIYDSQISSQHVINLVQAHVIKETGLFGSITFWWVTLYYTVASPCILVDKNRNINVVKPFCRRKLALCTSWNLMLMKSFCNECKIPCVPWDLISQPHMLQSAKLLACVKAMLTFTLSYDNTQCFIYIMHNRRLTNANLRAPTNT